MRYARLPFSFTWSRSGIDWVSLASDFAQYPDSNMLEIRRWQPTRSSRQKRKNFSPQRGWHFCRCLLRQKMSPSLISVRFLFKDHQTLDMLRLWEQIKGLNGYNFISSNFHNTLGITSLCRWTTTHIDNPLRTVGI